MPAVGARVMGEAVTATSGALLSRPRIYYGWWIVFGAFVAQFVTIGMQAPLSGAFLVPMTDALGWTRTEFVLATSIGTGVSALFGFFIGVYVDRFGARPLMLIGTTVLAISFVGISRVEELWQFIALRGVVFTVGFVMAGNLVVNVTVSKWFVERRGWAISIASLGVSLSSVVVTPLMVRIVDVAGWRDAWVILAVGAMTLLFPVALLMRRQPEDYGLLPDGAVDGDPRNAAAVERARADFENSFTRGEAVRTAAMWLLVIAFGFAMLGLVSMLVHAIPFLTDNGYTRTQAGFLFSVQGASALLSKFAWGWWMQRFHPRVLSALSFVCAGAGVALMAPAAGSGSIALMATAFLLFGWGIGGMIPLQEFIWAAFFGRRHLGAVRSAAMPASLIFGAGGPVAAALYFDLVGGYTGVIYTFAALWMVAAVLILVARPPQRPGRDAPGAGDTALIRPDAPGVVDGNGAGATRMSGQDGGTELEPALGPAAASVGGSDRAEAVQGPLAAGPAEPGVRIDPADRRAPGAEQSEPAAGSRALPPLAPASSGIPSPRRSRRRGSRNLYAAVVVAAATALVMSWRRRRS